MKFYLSITTFIFLLLMLQTGWYVADSERFTGVTPEVMDQMLLGWTTAFGFFFCYGMLLTFTWSRKKSKMSKAQKEVSDLIMILKEVREEQLAVINALKANVAIQPSSVEELNQLPKKD